MNDELKFGKRGFWKAAAYCFFLPLAFPLLLLIIMNV